MKLPHVPFAHHLLAGLTAAAFLGGCAATQRNVASEEQDRAFTTYFPAPTGNRTRLAVKDLIDVKGVVTTGGSEHLLKARPPAVRDAACLRIARERGVHIVGKTNVTEFAITVAGLNQYFGTPINRMARGRPLIPGGSSSGSAVAVANGYADVAFGTDTAGSIRVPAACCGVVGLKTTFGLVSLDGVLPISPKYLDTVGPMAKDIAGTVEGMELLQRGFAGRYQRARSSGKRITVGRLYLPGTDPKVDKAVDDALAAAQIKVVRLGEDFEKAWSQADTDAKAVAAGDAYIRRREFLGKPGVAARTKAAIRLGETQYPSGYWSALSRRAGWQRTLERTLQKVDFVVLPTMKNLPPRTPIFGGTAAFELLVLTSQNTAAVNYAGNPALAVPIPVEDRKIPLTSIQLIGRPMSEAELLNAGRVVEANTRRQQTVAAR